MSLGLGFGDGLRARLTRIIHAPTLARRGAGVVRSYPHSSGLVLRTLAANILSHE